MPRAEKVDLRKIVTLGGSQGVVLSQEWMKKKNWTKGTFVWVLYHDDKIVITKNNDQIPKRGKN